MPHILIACWGSHGDVDPYIGLGLGLQARGCTVTLATPEYYRDFVTRHGLGFTPIGPDVDPDDQVIMSKIMDRNDGTRYVMCELVYPATQTMFVELEAAVSEADLVVSHPLTAPATIAAERLGKPWLSTVLAPLSFFSEHDIPVMAPAPWLKSLEPLSAWPGRWFMRLGKRMTVPWSAPLHALRSRLGLPSRGNPVFEGQHSPHGVLALWSKVLGAPQPDWPPQVTITGHMFYDASHGTSLTPELERFLNAGEPPIVFTLGSSAVHSAGSFWQESLVAASRLGRRAVFLMGKAVSTWSSASLPHHLLVLDRAPHSLLMPRAAVVVHQCGVGTMAQSLRSGRPVLAVPFAHDQYDNAWRLTKLGMALTLPSTRYTAQRVARTLSKLLDAPHYARAAKTVAETVRAEPGVTAACDTVLQVLANHRPSTAKTS